MAVSFSRAAVWSMAMLDEHGRPMPYTPVTVRSTAGTLASLWTDSTKAVVAANPIPTDADGNLTIWTNPGNYTCETYIGGNVRAVPILVPADPDDLDLMSWHLKADADMPQFSDTNWNTYTARAVGNLYYAMLQSSGAQNALLQYKFPLSAGTWKVTYGGRKDTDGGIVSVRLDSVEKGTVDCYNASSAAINSSITGIAVATSKVTTVELCMATKNGSSSSYVGRFYYVALTRTA